jgi:hypothetical protein
MMLELAGKGRRNHRATLRLERLEDRCVPSAALPLDAGAGLDGDDLFSDPIFGGSAPAARDRLPSSQLSGATSAPGGQAALPTTGSDLQTPTVTPLLRARFPAAPPVLGRGSAAPPSGPQAPGVQPASVYGPNVLNSFPGMDFHGTGQGEPPDSNAAAGPNYVVETVNQQFTIFNKTTGTVQATASFASFFSGLPNHGQTAPPHGSVEFSDPVATYDDNSGRFIMGDSFVDSARGDSVEDIAVSTSSNPTTATTADWMLFQFHTGEGTPGATSTTAFWGDFPGKIGFNAETIVFTFNMFPGAGHPKDNTHVQVDVLDKANLLAGNGGQQTILTGATSLNRFDDTNGFFTLSAASMHSAAASSAMYFLTNDVANYGTQIDVVALPSPMTSTASSFVISKFNVNSFFTAYETGGNRLTTDLDSGMLSVVTRTVGGHFELAGAQTIATAASGGNERARWYEIDLTTSALQENDMAPFQTGGDTYYPAVDIDASGNLGLTFVESVGSKGSAGGEFPSMYVTAHKATDAAGTTEPPRLVFAGLTDNIGTRGGDIASVTVDPSGNFWACNEYITNDSTSFANWATGIAEFDIAALPPPTLTLLSVSSAPEQSAALTITLTGTNFIPAALGQWDSTTLATRVLSATQMQVTIPAALLVEEGNHTITVTDAAGTSSGLTFMITDAAFTSVAVANVTAEIGQSVTNAEVATFTDPGTDGTANDLSATVTFTDSNGVTHPAVTGSVQALGNKRFAVFASTPFAYSKVGAFAFSVQIHDVGSSTSTVGGFVNVLLPPGLFFTDGMNQLWLFSNGTFQNTGGFATKFAGGVDGSGNPEAFFFDGNNQLWRYDNGVFTNLGAFGTQLVAGSGAVAFTDTNNTLWVFHDATGLFTDTGATATRLTGGFNSAGSNFFAFTDASNRIFELTNSGTIVSTGAFGTRISAGADTTGNFEVWFTDGNNQIWRFDGGASSMTGAFALSIQASFGNVYFLDGNNEIWSLTDAGLATGTGAFATRISSGPGTDTLFFTDAANQIFEFQHGVFTNTGGFGVKLSAF